MPHVSKRGRRSVRSLFLFFVLLPALAAGCTSAAPNASCTILFEDNPAVFFYRQVYEVARGEDLTVSVGVLHGSRIDSVAYDSYSVSGRTGTSASYDYYTLILHEIRYPAIIRLTTAVSYVTLYHLGEEDDDPVRVVEDSPHLAINTLPFREALSRDGFVPIGWNTAPDGSGIHIGFGSRADRDENETLSLFPEWLACTPANAFTWERSEEGIILTGFHPTEGPEPGQNPVLRLTTDAAATEAESAAGGGVCSGTLVLPSRIDGLPVVAIAAGTFGDITAETVVLPPYLQTVEDGAFRSLTAEHLYLFDTLQNVSDRSFGDYRITHLHINAVQDPVYSGSYFDTFADKIDYLRSLKDRDKLVLFAGSSARFGYDSPMLEAAFPEYRVVNMGVYAYSNMLPQAMLVLCYMKEGDLLLSSPEFDAIDCQFCGHTELDKETFCMLEANYDMLSVLDCRALTNLFGAFADYQQARARLTPRSYSDSASFYDEDGVRQEQPTYNKYGDYILYRENNESRRLFGVKRASYNADDILPSDWDGLNRVYDAFLAQGVRVLFTYSPRSKESISANSSPESIRELDAQLRALLHVPVISDIDDSLIDARYFYGTDNHLSTEGVRLHTLQVIEDLRQALTKPPL